MKPRIETLNERKLVGKRLRMSLAENRTAELWKGFMPKRKNITNNVTNDLISISVYSPTYFTEFRLTNEFEKWASVEVSDYDNIPNDLEIFVLTGGLYAVFDYKGSSTDNSIFQFIFGTWLPGSAYFLDDRPHFEVLGDKYKNNDPRSEEEIWIPVKSKK